MVTQIKIDPFSNLHYASFYVLGLNNCFRGKIKITHEPFKSLKEGRITCILFIVVTEDKEYKIAVDFHDSNTVDMKVLEWSDVYAKINCHHIDTINDLKNKISSEVLFQLSKAKLLSIPPSFGINIFSPFQVFSFLGKILSSRLEFSEKKSIISGVLRMIIKRRPLKNYYQRDSMKNFIFHISSIWARDTDFINISRSNFIRASKSIHSVKFEGGLVNIGYDYSYMGNISDILYFGGKIDLKEYIKKTGMSYLVFNGPSVARCHGWKLAEYLSMGKAIISTNLYNDLPIPLEHGENIHFVEDNFDSIKEGLQYLIDNPEYVKKLEKGALQYWQANVTPEKVISRIVSFALTKS